MIIQMALAALAGALALTLGVLTDWGRSLVQPPTLPSKVAAKPELGGLLPDFRLTTEAAAYAGVSEKPLFNPTRRPAPTAPVAVTTEPPKPQIRRGLYQLVGVTDLGAVKIAQVKETNGARTHSVRQGDMLQELRVTEITSDRVTLAFAGETDVLTLPKFTASGRVPQPPAPPPVAVVPQPAPQGQTGIPQQAQPQTQQQAQTAPAPAPTIPPQAPAPAAQATASSQAPVQQSSRLSEQDVQRLESAAINEPTRWNRIRAELARRDLERQNNVHKQ